MSSVKFFICWFDVLVIIISLTKKSVIPVAKYNGFLSKMQKYMILCKIRLQRKVLADLVLIFRNLFFHCKCLVDIIINEITMTVSNYTVCLSFAE